MRRGRRSPSSSPTRKRKPGAYNYGSSGNYGTMHVPMEMLKAAAGFRMTHIPFTGAGPAVIALLGGQVDAIASGPATVVQQIKAGKLRALAHWGDRPLRRAARRAEPEAARLPGAVRAVVGAVRAGRHARRRSCSACAPRRAKVAADPAVQQTIPQAGSPIDYLDAPAVPDLLGRRRGGDDRGGAHDRQGRVAARRGRRNPNTHACGIRGGHRSAANEPILQVTRPRSCRCARFALGLRSC